MRRLQHINTRKCMYATSNGELLADDCCTGGFAGCEEQYFYYGVTSTDDFTFVHFQSQRCIFSNSDGSFGTFTCDPSSSDQHWRSVPISDTMEMMFRLKSKDSGLSKIIYFIIYIFPS